MIILQLRRAMLSVLSLRLEEGWDGIEEDDGCIYSSIYAHLYM